MRARADIMKAQYGTIEKRFRNPQGLNEILSEILGHPVRGDWDSDIPSEVYVGKWKKEQIKGKTAQQWGDMLEKYACSYLTKKLKGSGWTLLHGKEIGGKEYDCLGWKGKPRDKQTLDLAIEMYFPIPKKEQKYEFEYVRKQTDKMVRKLEKISAKSKYILIGVPHDSEITTRELLRPDIKVVHQEYKFKKVRLEKRKK